MLNKEIHKQRGFIVFGGGLDKKQWISAARQQGYIVLDCGDHAELFS